MSSNPYPSQLLNDLHHYFPELLYRSERFQSVQDVLQYITQIAQDNPYERLRRSHVSLPQNVLRHPPLSSFDSDQEQKEEEDQEQKEEQKEEEDQEQKEEEQKEEQKEPYQFHVSASAYVVTSPSEPESVGVSTSNTQTSRRSNSQEFLHQFMNERRGRDPNASSNPEEALRQLFQRRRPSLPMHPSSNRFRISVPLDTTQLLSSQYSSPVPSLLQGLSQLHSLQDLLQPVIVRPTEQHLAENTYVYRSEISLNDNCAICQDPMEAGQETRTILACSHCFHRECVDTWFQDHVRCPTCRHDVRDGS